MSETVASSHPLDGSDENECYKTMMAERTALITARRETEDNLIKTIIQLSVALIALLAGFVTQVSVQLTQCVALVFSTTVVLLAFAIIFGLAEQFFSSKAYEAQLEQLESYYTKKIDTFCEVAINKWVRGSQVVTFSVFVVALVCLVGLATLQAMEKIDVKPTASASATTASSSSSSSSSSASAAPAK